MLASMLIVDFYYSAESRSICTALSALIKMAHKQFRFEEFPESCQNWVLSI